MNAILDTEAPPKGRDVSKLPATKAMNDALTASLTRATTALAECKTSMFETKRIADIAGAAKTYAKRQHLSEHCVKQAHWLQTTARAQMGHILKATTAQRATGGDSGGRPPKGGPKKEPPSNPTPTLADLGLDKKTSSAVQQLAELEETKPVLFEQVRDGETTVQIVLRDIRRTERMAEVATISKGDAPLGMAERYPLLYVDPPWQYDHTESQSRAIENHYPTMNLQAIMDLPIDEVAFTDCVLFLWTTSPKLADALAVLGAWDFTYKTCAVWDKQVMGMGYYFRQQHELLLVATRGRPPTPAPGDRPSSIFSFPRGKHSSKPVEIYELIESMYPVLPKLELFARTARDGWGSWGNQAKRP